MASSCFTWRLDATDLHDVVLARLDVGREFREVEVVTDQSRGRRFRGRMAVVGFHV